MRPHAPDNSQTQELADELAALRARLAGALAAQADSQARLQRSEAMFHALTDATAAAVWMCDARGEISIPCPSWARFTGQAFVEYQGRGWLQAVHPEDREKAAGAWAHAVEGQGPYQAVYRLRRHDGAYRLTQARGALMRDEAGLGSGLI